VEEIEQLMHATKLTTHSLSSTSLLPSLSTFLSLKRVKKKSWGPLQPRGYDPVSSSRSIPPSLSLSFSSAAAPAAPLTLNRTLKLRQSASSSSAPCNRDAKPLRAATATPSSDPAGELTPEGEETSKPQRDETPKPEVQEAPKGAASAPALSDPVLTASIEPIILARDETSALARALQASTAVGNFGSSCSSRSGGSSIGVASTCDAPTRAGDERQGSAEGMEKREVEVDVKGRGMGGEGENTNVDGDRINAMLLEALDQYCAMTASTFVQTPCASVRGASLTASAAKAVTAAEAATPVPNQTHFASVQKPGETPNPSHRAFITNASDRKPPAGAPAATPKVLQTPKMVEQSPFVAVTGGVRAKGRVLMNER
jgi:hypothetical protein